MMRAYCVVAAAFCLACANNEVTNPYIAEGRAPSLLESGGLATSIVTPASAKAGVPFDVSVVTLGGGCIRQGDTEVSYSDMSAEVRPYEVFPRMSSNLVCTDDIRFLTHTATLQFARPGTVTVRVVGARNVEGVRQRLVVERRVVIER